MANRIMLNQTSYHGAGAIQELPAEVKSRGLKKALICCGPTLLRHGVIARVTDVLDAAGLSYEIFSDIKPNPTIANVTDGVAAFKAAGADYLIAIGGGSPMDTSKAIGIIINNPEFADVRSLEGVADTKKPCVPIIAIPTTAGTAAEVTINYVITDEENRRYCPWLVKSIESPIEHPIDYDHVFAEAVALGQEVMSHPKGEPLEWTYWLTRDDIELMRCHNRLFMVANYAEEQILRYYRVPEPDTPLQFIKFRYSAEILERIGVNPALRQNLNNQNIGNVMKRLGFKKIHKKNGNGWAVIEKEGSEINNDAFIDPNDTVED